MTGCSESDGYSTSKVRTDNTAQTKLPRKTPIVETAPSQWYIRIIAQDVNRGLISQNAQLGELEGNAVVQQHTLKSYKDFDAYLDVLFVDPVGVTAGQYRSNFHTYEEGMEDRWTFTVMSNDPTAEITLTLRGLYVLTPYEDNERTLYKEYRSTTNPLLKQMKLVDSQTGNEIAAVQNGKVQTYAFNMNNQTTRNFEWVVETSEVQLSNTARRSAVRKVVSREENSIKRSAIQQYKNENFDLDNPPFLKGGH